VTLLEDGVQKGGHRGDRGEGLEAAIDPQVGESAIGDVDVAGPPGTGFANKGGQVHGTTSGGLVTGPNHATNRSLSV
jgi:hypothetical protein